MDRRKVPRVLAFLGIALGIPWLVRIQGSSRSLTTATTLLLLTVCSPAIAAIVVRRLLTPGPLRRPFGITWAPLRWFAVAWLLPFALSFATLGVSLLFPGASYSPTEEEAKWTFVPEGSVPSEALAGSSLHGGERIRPAEGILREHLLRDPPKFVPDGFTAQPVIATHDVEVSKKLRTELLHGPTEEAIKALGVEIGWRGFLLAELLPLGFWRASILVGLVWGVWHAPLLVPGYPGSRSDAIADLLLQVVGMVLLSPLFSWVRIRARSVLPVAVLHGCVVASGWIPDLVLPREPRFASPPLIAHGILLLAVWGGIALRARAATGGPLEIPGSPERGSS